MTFWSFYFLAKAYLHFQGSLHLHLLSNLLLMALVLLPIPGETRRERILSPLRTVLAALLAAALLWHDSWLPAPLHAWRAAAELFGTLSAGYLIRFASGAANLPTAAILLAILIACELAVRRGFKPIVFAFLALFIAGVREFGVPSQTVSQRVSQFYEAEKRRVIRLPRPENGPPFDIVLLHVCSLSWDDLRTAGRLRHPLLSRFDTLIKNFNTVSSYSTPSALRLLRSLCGQVSQEELYRPWPRECSLLDELRGRGYKAYTAMNHRGERRRMAEQLRTFAHASPTMDTSGLAPQLVNFDETPIYGNLDVLQRWLQVRTASAEPRALLYYNTITLHGGAHLPVPGWWKEKRIDQYQQFLDMLSQDLDRFYELLKKSERNTVVLLIPEHGLGLQGGPLQMADLREIPLPELTLVPVGVKFIGKRSSFSRFEISASSDSVSYMAIADLIASFLKQSPFSEKEQKDETVVVQSPPTSLLTENQKARITRMEGDFYLYAKERKWIKLRSEMIRILDTSRWTRG